MKNMILAVVITGIIGISSIASAMPTFTGPTTVLPGATETYSVVGSPEDASTNGVPGTGGWSGVVWIDYPHYKNMISSVSSATTEMGSFYSLDPTSYSGSGVVFTAAPDPTVWTEDNDVDAAKWFDFDVTFPTDCWEDCCWKIELFDDFISPTGYNIIVCYGMDPDAYDYGDAPDSYSTLRDSGGARHRIRDNYMGNLIDENLDGLPDPCALGDDNDWDDDEDGVVFYPPIIAGETADVNVVASEACILNAWMDFNADGDWSDAGEQIFTDTALSAGQNSLAFNVPAQAEISYTFCRFRVDSAGGLSYTGLADDGEVEDYRVLIEEPPGCFPSQHPDYNIWVSVGKPACWCYRYQCKGDANGYFDGKDADGERRWVDLADLIIFGAGWLKVDTEAGFNTWICADFDHTFDGKDQDGLRKWVNLPDLTIFGAGWLKVDTEPHFTQNPCFP